MTDIEEFAAKVYSAPPPPRPAPPRAAAPVAPAAVPVAPPVAPAAPVAVPAAPQQRPAGPVLEGLDPDLANRLNQAREAYRLRFNKDLPITSGVRTREDQQRLYDRWKAGDKSIYMPLNPADYPKQTTFHTDAVDIPTSVPEPFLREFGIHRPLGSKDPVHAVLMPSSQPPATAPAAPTAAVAPAAPAVPMQSPSQTVSQAAVPMQSPSRTVTQAAAAPAARPAAPGATPAAPAAPAINPSDLMSSQAVDAFAAQAYGQPPKKGAVASKVTSFLRSSAALADTLYGVVPAVAGMVAYAADRAGGRTPEEAAQYQARVTGALERPVGRAFGVTETPEYKGEASQKIMEFIGENVGKGADWISKQTGMPKADVEYYLNLGLTAAPFSKTVQREVGMAGQAAGQAAGKVVEAAAQVTPAPIRTAVRATTEAIAPGATTAPARAPTLGVPAAPAAPAAPQPVLGRGSVGAAGVPDATIIRQALLTATPEFQQLFGNMPLDKVNTPVVLRRLEGDSLPIPIRLTEGQATGDVVKLSTEQNLRGKQPAFAQRFNEQNTQLVENVPLIRERAAPDVYATKTIESSQALIDAYKALDDTRSADITAAYKKLEDAAGGQFPVDGAALARNAEAALAKKLKTDFLPSAIKNQLERFKNGEPMTFEQFEAMRTNLAAEIRKAERSGDGNAAMASSIVREALENLPLKGEAAALKPLADQARALAKARFDALKKDPAYKAAVDDAVPADKYFDKFVVNGVNKNINTMVETLGRDSVAHQHMRAGTINWLSDKAGIVDGRGNFSQANYNKALKRLDDVNNFGAIFDPDSQLQLRTLGNVAAYTQFQPRGSFVNNSNTLVGYLASKAAGGLEQVGNVAGLKTIGYPIGSEIRRGVSAARERREVERALSPTAGTTLPPGSQPAGSTLQEVSQGRVPNIINPPPPSRIEPTFDFTLPPGATDLEALGKSQFKRKK